MYIQDITSLHKVMSAFSCVLMFFCNIQFYFNVSRSLSVRAMALHPSLQYPPLWVLEFALQWVMPRMDAAVSDIRFGTMNLITKFMKFQRVRNSTASLRLCCELPIQYSADGLLKMRRALSLSRDLAIAKHTHGPNADESLLEVCPGVEVLHQSLAEALDEIDVLHSVFPCPRSLFFGPDSHALLAACDTCQMSCSELANFWWNRLWSTKCVHYSNYLSIKSRLEHTQQYVTFIMDCCCVSRSFSNLADSKQFSMMFKTLSSSAVVLDTAWQDLVAFYLDENA